MSGSQQLLLGGAAPAVTPVDPYFYSVTSLLHGDGTNGGQNNTFLDSSTNNFTITRNGNTTQGSFSPFSQTGWGNYFNGPNTGSYLRTPASTDFQLGTSDFTIEFWAYTTDITSDTTVCQTDSGGSGFFGMLLNYSNGTNITWYATSNGSSWNVINGGVLCSAASIRNTWTHFAYVRNGSTFTAYVNGIAVYTTTSSASIYQSANQFVFGSSFAGSHPSNFGGYLSNFRYVKGTAVYTSNFTPSTTPLTAITNTKLLSCQANRFLDASASAHTLTVGGSPSVQPFSPFNPITAYSTSAVGGSGYFDGSGDNISIADNANLRFGTSDYTIEGWIYPITLPAGDAVVVSKDASGQRSWIVALRSAYGLAFFIGGTNQTGTNQIPTNAWTHFAVVRSGTSAAFFINGTRVATFTDSSNYTQTAPVEIGASVPVWNDPNNAYITNVRLVKGTAVYSPSSTTLTVPTAPLTAVSNTQLLCNFTNGAIFDNAAVADYETVGNAQISTSVKKYGTGSIAFDGTGDKLVTPFFPWLQMGSSDWTIEMWVYLNSAPGGGAYYALYVNRASTASFAPIGIFVNSSRQIEAYFSTSGSSYTSSLTTGQTIPTTTWTHVAVVKIGTLVKVYFNGNGDGSTATISGSLFANTAQLWVGGENGGNDLNGYIDDFRISKGIARYPYNFTPPTAEFPNIGGTVTLTADPYFDYTTLLLPGNGTNGAQNNTFLDSSTNAFTITRNGNTTQGTFSPFSQTGWGNYFDGSGDYLSLADNAAFQYGTGDFTIEFWFYMSATAGSGNYYVLYDGRPSGTSSGAYVDIAINNATPESYVSGSTVITGSALSANTWYHFAYARSGTSTKMFVNGTQVGSTYTDTTNYVNGTARPVIGTNGFSVGTSNFNGYFSNYRVVKGTAVYTANFTPPTSPLTAITNTSLLTCQSNRFIDNSSNNFTITRNGDVSVQAFSPFNPTAAWSAATNGGSGYFDGSGDYLTAPDNAAFDLGAGAFTLECFAYLNARAGAYDTLIAQWNNSSDSWLLLLSGNTIQFYGNGALAKSESVTITTGQWYHFACTRDSSNNLRLYANGVKLGSDTAYSTTLINSTASPSIGCRGDGLSTTNFNGYLSSVRVIKGSAEYTGSTYTVPTAPLTAITNTSLLCNFTNAGIYDATSKNDLETVGNAQISTTQSKFGGSSMYFDGTGDYLFTPSKAITSMAGDFTVEMWIYRNSGNNFFFTVGDSVGSSGFDLYIGNSGANLRLYSGNSVVIDNALTSVSFPTSTWTHVAVVRFSGSVRMYVAGFQAGSAWSSTSTFSGNIHVGAEFYNGSITGTCNGYLQDVRVTNGIARYTSNFTPPTTAFLTL